MHKVTADTSPKSMATFGDTTHTRTLNFHCVSSSESLSLVLSQSHLGLMALDLLLLMDCNKETAVDQWPINLIMNPEHVNFNR